MRCHRLVRVRDLPPHWSNGETTSTVSRELPAASDPSTSLLCEVRELSGEPLGWVVVDASVDGRAHGGVRVAPHVDVSMLAALARRMTLKFGFIGLPNGGAKAGVLGDPEGPAEERLTRLQRFARAVAPVVESGYYTPHPDLGTTFADIRASFSSPALRPASRVPNRDVSGDMTSISVIVAAERAARFMGRELRGMTVAVQGFGKVGGAVASGFASRGARVVAVSTSTGTVYDPGGLDISCLHELRGSVGRDLVHNYDGGQELPREAIVSLPVDLFSPCALESLDETNVASVAASIVSPGANCAVSREAEELLTGDGRICVPDFVSSCGGSLGGSMSFAGLRHDEIVAIMHELLGNRITALYEQAQVTGQLLSVLAAEQAMERFHSMKEDAERFSPGNTGLRWARRLYGSGVVPGSVSRLLAKRYFVSRLC